MEGRVAGTLSIGLLGGVRVGSACGGMSYSGARRGPWNSYLSVEDCCGSDWMGCCEVRWIEGRSSFADILPAVCVRFKGQLSFFSEAFVSNKSDRRAQQMDGTSNEFFTQPSTRIHSI